MVEAVLNVLGPVFLISLMGFLYSRWFKPDMGFINRANMDLFLPALIFSALTENPWQFADYQWLVLAAGMLILLPGILSAPFVGLSKMHWQVVLPPVMFNNSGNLGIPLLVFAFGEQVLPIAVMIFIVENTLHFTVGAAMINHGHHSPFKSLVAVFQTPMIWATLFAFLFHGLDWHLPEALDRAVDLTADMAIPLMLFALGIRLGGVKFEGWRIPVVAGIWIPLIGWGCFAITLAVLAHWVELPSLHRDILLLYAVLPPAVLNFMVAERYLESARQKHQVAEIVLWGNLLSIVPIALVLSWLSTQ